MKKGWPPDPRDAILVSMTPVQTYVCVRQEAGASLERCWVLWSALPLLIAVALSIDLLRYLRIQFFCHIEFLPVGEHETAMPEIAHEVVEKQGSPLSPL